MLPLWLIFGFLTAVITTLCILLYFSLHTLRTLTQLNFQETVASRHQWTRIIDEQRSEIRALSESLLRSEGKVYIHPSSPDVGPISKENLSPSPSAWRMRANPPKIDFVKSNNG